MGLFLSRNVIVGCRFLCDYILWKKFVGCDFLTRRPKKKVVRLTSRTGRHLQRYDEGCRQVVGCIPYRYNGSNSELEVLMISAQKGHGIFQFPKGGWEMDESMEQAALRETVEEAGVEGNVQRMLGKWRYKSKRQSVVHEGYMFPLVVNKQLEDWPEKNIRRRIWVSVSEAKKVCPHEWMKEALDELIYRKQDGCESSDGSGVEVQVIDYDTENSYLESI